MVFLSLCCRAHIEHEFGKLRSSNTVSIRVKSVGDWWEADPESKLFRLAEKALAQEWNVQPLFVREGGTMPVSHRPSPLCAGQRLQGMQSVGAVLQVKGLLLPTAVSRGSAAGMA